MAFAQPEADDDAARMERTEVQWLSMSVQKLLSVKQHLKPDERRFVDDLDTRVCVLNQHPGAQKVEQIKALTWKYRRQLPRALAPKLPPHDPIVKEMEGR